MPNNNGAVGLSPNARVLLNGQVISPEMEAALQSVAIAEDLDAASMVTLTLVTWDNAQQKMTWIDNSAVDLGVKVEIQMGYQNTLKTIIMGEITGLEPEFSQDRVPMLVVRGHDLRHRLMRGRKTKSFTKMKDSAIASQIASARGLSPTVEDTKVDLEYVLQHNQTDWEFLQERAARIGYEVVVENKKFYFGSPRYTASKVLILTREDGLIEFSPRLSSLTQVQQVEVRSWLPKDKNEVISKAAAGQEGGTMGGKTSGAKAVKQFGESSHTIVTQPVFSKAEADQMALGQFKEMAIAYITGDGICRGNADLRAGTVIEIKGLGTRFSGLYYVTSTEHCFSHSQGYTTSFTVRRNAT
jgi:phage protein D